MIHHFVAQFPTLAQYFSGHVLLSIIALLLGMTISIPLGILAAKLKNIREIILVVISTMQTIPSLALLALMVPLLGGMIGWWPALIALIIYSMLPILQNTMAALENIDPDLVEAANGLGMTPKQKLWRIEMPLSVPVIIAGIRTSMVWTVGTATLATPIGADSLGYYIFLGLNTRQPGITLFGCFFSAGLALLLDRLIGLLQSGVSQRRKSKVILAMTTFFAILLLGIAAPNLQEALQKHFTNQSDTDEILSDAPDQSKLTLIGENVVIGSKRFTEQYILAELLAEFLRRQRANVILKLGLGSELIFDALHQNAIDLYVEYSGTVWSTVMQKTTIEHPQHLPILVTDFLWKKFSIMNLGSLGFENAYSFAMRRDVAHKLNISTVEDLAKHAPSLTIAGDFDFFSRPDGKKVIESYGLNFNRRIVMDSRLMYDAVKSGQVDIVTSYTTDGQIAAYDLIILSDTLNVFPPYDALLLVSPNVSQRSQLLKVLRKLINSIKDEDMRQANAAVDLQGKDIKSVGIELLSKISR